MRATIQCPYCNKTADVLSESRIDSIKRIRLTLKCGHTYLEKLIAIEIPEGRDSKWNDFFKFQQEGIRFIEHANYKVLVADEMGLGKTIQYQGALRYNFDGLTPCLIICKASLIYQHMREYLKWVLEDNKILSDRFDTMPIPIMDGQCTPIPGFQVYILSMDLLSKSKIQTWIQESGFKTIIIDESHHFKNLSSKRTTALNLSCKNVPYRIALSGTPILNNTKEYFPTLNFIKPEHYPSETRFIRDYLEYDHGTKRWLGLKQWRRDEFFQRTSSYIIRREKKDVLKDLPPMRLNEQVVSSFDRTFATAYNKKLDELQEMLNTKKDDFGMKAGFIHILAKMSELRHITGLAKVPAAFEYIQEFLDSTDSSSKICIGIHHKDVAIWLQTLISSICICGASREEHPTEVCTEFKSKYTPIMISGADSPAAKQDKENQFKLPENRIAICNILAVGEGRNFQFCANFLVIESQWNQEKENQFAGRFQRPIKCECGTPYIKITPDDGVPYYRCPKCNSSTDIVPIQGDYLNAANTIDEFFVKLKQLKSKVVNSSMNWSFETDYSAIYQLAQEVVLARMKAGV